MGAGGQQPLRSQPLSRGVDSTLRRPGKAEALTVKIRDIRSVRVRNAKCGPGIRAEVRGESHGVFRSDILNGFLRIPVSILLASAETGRETPRSVSQRRLAGCSRGLSFQEPSGTPLRINK
jgi:hypothetical protein